jgi:hypothetical protein
MTETIGEWYMRWDQWSFRVTGTVPGQGGTPPNKPLDPIGTAFRRSADTVVAAAPTGQRQRSAAQPITREEHHEITRANRARLRASSP